MSTSRRMAWCIWCIASIFYAYQYILRVMPNIMLPDMMQQFHMDAAIFGQFSGAFYVGYCVMHLPIGILLDRYGPKYVMSACMLLTVIGLLPMLFAEHWVYPILGRLLIGVGSSAAILGVFNIVRITFSEQHFTRMLSFSVTIGLMGAIYGGVPISHSCIAYGYQTVVAMLAGFGVLFAGLTYLCVPKIASRPYTPILQDLKAVFANRQVMWVCALAGLMVGPMEGFADAWGSEFLKQAYRLDTNTANYITSMIYMGMCFAPLLSRVAEQTGYYLRTIAGAGVVMLVAFIMLLAGMLTASSMPVVFFLVGICCAYQVLAIYKASTYAPAHVAGLATAVANMVIMSFGYGFHSIIGVVIEAFKSHGGAYAFSYGIAVVPVTLLLGSAGFCLMARREKKLLSDAALPA